MPASSTCCEIVRSRRRFRTPEPPEKPITFGESRAESGSIEDMADRAGEAFVLADLVWTGKDSIEGELTVDDNTDGALSVRINGVAAVNGLT